MADVYAEWLGIELGPRPPNHYTLFGLPLFADDLSLLEQSYQQRYEHIRRYQVGNRSAEAVQLLNELSNAYQQLANAATKQQYDDALRNHLAALTSAVSPNTATVALEAVDEEPGEAEPAQSAPWFYTVRGNIIGPVTWSDLEHAMWSGTLEVDSEAWQQGWTARKWASELFPNVDMSARVQPVQQPQQRPEPQTQPVRKPSVRPYQRTDPDGRSLSGFLVTLGLVLGAGLLMQAFAVWKGINDISWILATVASVAAFVIVGIAVFEPSFIFDSIFARPLRSAFGDTGARNRVMAVGIILMVMGYTTMAGRVSHRLWYITRRFPAPPAPNISPFSTPGVGGVRATAPTAPQYDVDQLVEDLHSDDFSKLSTALRELTQVEAPEHREAIAKRLLEVIYHTNHSHRMSAAHGLRQWISINELPQLSHALKDQRVAKEVRSTLVTALGTLSEPAAIEVLASVIDDPDIRIHAITPLSEHATQAESLVLQYLRSDDPATRKAVCRWLERFGSDVSLPTLREREVEPDVGDDKIYVLAAINRITSRLESH